MAAMFDQIAELIGKQAAEKLRGAFGGQTVYIPRHADARTAERNRRIRALRARKRSPASIDDLMRQFGLSRRQIWNILGERA